MIKSPMVETRSGTIEVHRNASSTNNPGRREIKAIRIASLEQQIQDLSRSMEQIVQQNQELSRKLMEQLDHQPSGEEET